MRLYVLAITGIVASAGVARAETTHTCTDGVDVSVDGMLDDWDGADRLRVGGTSPDGSLGLACVYDRTRLALSLDVKDDRLIRLRKGPGLEDAIELELAIGGGAPLRIAVYPGALGVAPRRTLGGKPVPRWLAVEDTLQDKGFSVELVVPLAKIPGFGSGTPAIRARAVFRDADQATGKATDDVAIDLRLELAAKKDLMTDFLRAINAKPSQVETELAADVDRGRRGKERIVLVGKGLRNSVIGVLADRFAFVSLPEGNVQAVRTIDLRGEGRTLHLAAIVRQQGNGGSRDLLLVFEVVGGQLNQVFAAEIRKQMGDRILESAWKVVPKKRGKIKAELVIEAMPARGWDATSWNEIPASDLAPINLPWDPARYGAVYWLDAGEIKSRPIPIPKRR